jgi:hypothetical protein
MYGGSGGIASRAWRGWDFGFWKRVGEEKGFEGLGELGKHLVPVPCRCILKRKSLICLWVMCFCVSSWI